MNLTSLTTASSLTSSMWVGLILGISFVAQPAKFKTPQLTRIVALATGRQIFRSMHRAEIVLAIASALPLTYSFPTQGHYQWLLYLAAALLLIQMKFLMPPLSQRVDSLLSGRNLPPSMLHAIFATLEIIKVVLLIAFSFSSLISTPLG